MEGFLVYALEEGGLYHVKRATRPMFDETVASGEMLEHTGVHVGGEPQYRVVHPAYVAWSTIEADFDFILGRPR